MSKAKNKMLSTPHGTLGTLSLLEAIYQLKPRTPFNSTRYIRNLRRKRQGGSLCRAFNSTRYIRNNIANTTT